MPQLFGNGGEICGRVAEPSSDEQEKFPRASAARNKSNHFFTVSF
jgi:hypothetical protein